MDSPRLNRLLRIAVAFGVLLPVVPWLLNFPRDPRFCFDVRVGSDVCGWASLAFLALASIGWGATFARMTPSQRDWFVPKSLGVGALWFALPFIVPYARSLAGW